MRLDGSRGKIVAWQRALRGELGIGRLRLQASGVTQATVRVNLTKARRERLERDRLAAALQEALDIGLSPAAQATLALVRRMEPPLETASQRASAQRLLLRRNGSATAVLFLVMTKARPGRTPIWPGTATRRPGAWRA